MISVTGGNRLLGAALLARRVCVFKVSMTLATGNSEVTKMRILLLAIVRLMMVNSAQATIRRQVLGGLKATGHGLAITFLRMALREASTAVSL